jgi:hypothetical protein
LLHPFHDRETWFRNRWANGTVAEIAVLNLALLAVSSIMWAAENTYFIDHASAHATKACTGRTSFFDGPNSYYWCLRRVEAGEAVTI